jgi:phosphopantothenoylcysteine decarboxylase/phosphopantothenate--cysteine ligase
MSMRFLITAGGTREYIDPVRFISNASSGRMGNALARAALKAGHEVTLITAPTALKPPAGARVVEVETTAEMFAAVKKHFPKCDCLIMAAAVADFTPIRRSKTKIKKDGLKPILQLKPTPDILKWASRQRRVCTAHRVPQIIVGFALEDRNLRPNAEKKMQAKHLDLIVANTPQAIGAKTSAVHIKSLGSDWIRLAFASKTAIAKRIVSLIEKTGGSGKRKEAELADAPHRVSS